MPLILPGNVGSATAATGFNVANSCRFNSVDNAYMGKTSGSNGTATSGTFSCWIKRGNLGATSSIMSQVEDSSNFLILRFTSGNALDLRWRDGGSGTDANLTTNRLFRDPSAWMNIVVKFLTSDGTGSNRVKIYINGVQETSFSSSDYPTQNDPLYGNVSSGVYRIGDNGFGATGEDFDGYITEVVWLDGTSTTSTSFGEFDEDSGIWKPKDVSGLTFGTNGFYLDFEASGNLGNDANGGADLTEVNLAAIDQSTDTCTNNFATLNPLNPIVHTFEEGNLRIDGSGDNWDSAFSTIGASSGKFYFELKFLALSGGLRRAAMGVVDARGQTQFATNEVGYNVTNATGDSVGYNGNGTSNTIKKNDSAQYNGTEWSVDDIICMAVDLDNGAVYFRVNGGSFLNSGDPTSGSNRTGAVTLTTGESYVFGGTAYGATTEWEFNFGSPCYSESGGNSDANGHGNFNQAVPSGYFALCTKNLAENS